MPLRRLANVTALAAAIAMIAGCKGREAQPASVAAPAPTYFHVDPKTAGSVKGTVRFSGKGPIPAVIDQSSDPACVATHQGKANDESLVVSPKGMLANAFIYVERGLQDKTFEVPSAPVTIDQSGCWFRPHILGIQTGQTLQVVNSDPVTHNIHPMAQINREWNHSQGPGDPPLIRKFLKPEVMVPVKCNIHSWMHAFIGVLSHPYFAVSKDDGTFEIGNLPPGTYTLAIWQEKLGTQEQQIVVPPAGAVTANFTLKAK